MNWLTNLERIWDTLPPAEQERRLRTLEQFAKSGRVPATRIETPPRSATSSDSVGPAPSVTDAVLAYRNTTPPALDRDLAAFTTRRGAEPSDSVGPAPSLIDAIRERNRR